VVLVQLRLHALAMFEGIDDVPAEVSYFGDLSLHGFILHLNKTYTDSPILTVNSFTSAKKILKKFENQR
jgi:hypothetical protein